MAGPFAVGPIHFDGVSMVTATLNAGQELGTRREEDGKLYVLVYNAGGQQISIGEGCILSAVSGYSVTVSSITMADKFFGVVHHATLTTATYGWVVARGISKVAVMANSTVAAADYLQAGGDGRWTKHVSASTDVFDLGADAKVTVATASGGIGEAFVNLMFA